MTERDQAAIDKDLAGMVEAAERADAAKSGAKAAISPLHAVGHLGTGQFVMWDSCSDEADEAKSGAKEAISPLHAAGFCSSLENSHMWCEFSSEADAKEAISLLHAVRLVSYP